MWTEIYFSVLEKTKVVEIYSFSKEGLIGCCLGHMQSLEFHAFKETYI
jgi:hypothetical protein